MRRSAACMRLRAPLLTRHCFIIPSLDIRAMFIPPCHLNYILIKLDVGTYTAKFGGDRMSWRSMKSMRKFTVLHRQVRKSEVFAGIELSEQTFRKVLHLILGY